MRHPPRINRRKFVLGAAGLATTATFAASPRSRAWSVATPAAPGAGDLPAAATGAYVFAWPLVLMDLTRQQLTAVPAPSPRQAPINQFAHAPRFPDHTFETVVSPNVDSLYSSAWLDLAGEPMVLSLPDTGERYYVMQMLDAWTNVFASPGSRTTGNGAGDYAIVGPGWTGAVPSGIQTILAPTTTVWLIGRTETTGEADYAAVHALQAQMRLTPLGAWGTDYQPPAEVPVDPAVDLASTPTDQIAAMPADRFWTSFARCMIDNPPAPADAPVVQALARLGIVPGQPLDWTALTPDQAAALETGRAEGQAQVEAAGKHPPADLRNGWAIAYGLGSYGTRYLVRAATAWVGLGANLPEDGVYPTTRVDHEGNPLHGANRYLLHFEATDIPPVDGFWSLTMYDNRQHLVENPIGRYAIRGGDDLVFGDDGSLDISIQHESPGRNAEANWLPAPPDGFNLMLRLYWPRPEVLDGSWVPPAVSLVR